MKLVNVPKITFPIILVYIWALEREQNSCIYIAPNVFFIWSFPQYVHVYMYITISMQNAARPISSSSPFPLHKMSSGGILRIMIKLNLLYVYTVIIIISFILFTHYTLYRRTN